MVKNVILNGREVLPIGLGTYGFGEETLKAQGVSDSEQIDSMVYSFNKGVNYVVGYLSYANGNTVKLLAKAMEQSKNPLYLTFCAYPDNYTKLSEMKEKFVEFLKLMNVKKVDTFMVSSQMEGRFGRAAVQDFMEETINSNLADTLGVNNFNLEQLNDYFLRFGNKIVLHELCHNFEIRVFEELGIIQRNKELGIQTIIYQPIRRNRTATRNWPMLVSLSNKYGKTQNQIILNWLYRLGILIMIKSGSNKHIDENIDALSFEMSNDDIELINNFKIDWKVPELDWLNFNSEKALYVAKLPNVFDNIYDSNK